MAAGTLNLFQNLVSMGHFLSHKINTLAVKDASVILSLVVRATISQT